MLWPASATTLYLNIITGRIFEIFNKKKKIIAWKQVKQARTGKKDEKKVVEENVEIDRSEKGRN